MNNMITTYEKAIHHIADDTHHHGGISTDKGNERV
jgi:hypothetical protein